MSVALLLGLAGALGATCRFLVGLATPDARFRAGTLLVNAVGSFLLGLVVFGPTTSETVAVAGTGFCGAFTTFSSFGFETVELWECGRPAAAATNAVTNLASALAGIGLAAVLVG